MVEYRGLVTVEKIRVQISSSFLFYGGIMEKNIDVTSKYLDMIDSFECDFVLAGDVSCDFDLSELQEQIYNNSNLKLIHDIELLQELSFNLRHGVVKIVQVNNF